MEPISVIAWHRRFGGGGTFIAIHLQATLYGQNAMRSGMFMFDSNMNLPGQIRLDADLLRYGSKA